jgi:hypothetical protein
MNGLKDKQILLITVTVLTVLTVIAVLLSNLLDWGSDTFKKFGLGGVLAEIISLFVLLVRNSIRPKQINIYLTIPENLQQAISDINWDHGNCFVVVGDKKEKIRLVKTGVGPGFQVFFSEELSGKISESDIIEFELKDEKSNKWRVGPFYLYERTRILEYLGPNLANNLTQLNYD